MKGKIKHIALALAALILLSLFVAPQGGRVNAEEAWDYEQSFDDAESINRDFNAYYLTKFMGILTLEQVTQERREDTHWYVDGDCVRRANDVASELNADSISMLTLKQKFTDFHMQIDVRQGTGTVYWAAFCVRQDQPGKMFFEDGAGIYVEQEGAVRIWGYELDGGPFLCGTLSDYTSGVWYTYDITVSGNLITLQVGENPAVTIRVPWEYYREGYITLMAINNDAAFRNMKIKRLPAVSQIGSDFPGGQAKDASTASDSLDVLAAQKPSDGGLSSDETPSSHQGLYIGLGVGVGVAAIAVVAAALLPVRKRKQ